ncbi:MAG TPA: acyl-CoA dehydrogenase family protein [Thermoplasmata archaeon]|nr:acyl-CoA dehydrogenase family protein [Thermoplasmata archaeon]
MTVQLPPLPQDPIVSEIREVAERLRLSDRYRELDRHPAFPRAEFRALGEARLLGLHTAESLGGRGLPLPRAGVALFHLAHASGTTFAKLSLQPEFSSVLAEHGAPELVERWFRPLIRGEQLVGNHLTEPGAGSDAVALEMTATPDGDQYVLNGTKSEAAFAADADAAIVYAKVPSGGPRGGITAFLVPQGLPGIARHPGIGDLGERWQRRGTVAYTRVRVPKSHRIGEEGAGFDYVRAELTRERALLAAIYLGVARASWDETVAYVGERVAFGRPLSAQEAVAFPLVEDGARLSATWQYLERTLERLERGERADAEAAMAKWMAGEAALVAIDHAIQFHGGRGYSQALPHEQRWRDVRSGPIAHGPAEIMHLVAARQLWPRPAPSSR